MHDGDIVVDLEVVFQLVFHRTSIRYQSVHPVFRDKAGDVLQIVLELGLQLFDEGVHTVLPFIGVYDGLYACHHTVGPGLELRHHDVFHLSVDVYFLVHLLHHLINIFQCRLNVAIDFVCYL